jgi:hypothetical protein
MKTLIQFKTTIPPVLVWTLLVCIGLLPKAQAVSPPPRRPSLQVAHRDEGQRFVVRADEKLTAFVELERAVCVHLITEQV